MPLTLYSDLPSLLNLQVGRNSNLAVTLQERRNEILHTCRGPGIACERPAGAALSLPNQDQLWSEPTYSTLNTSARSSTSQHGGPWQRQPSRPWALVQGGAARRVRKSWLLSKGRRRTTARQAWECSRLQQPGLDGLGHALRVPGSVVRRHLFRHPLRQDLRTTST